MRPFLLVSLLATAAGAAAAPALAQTADRYGGVANYPSPAQPGMQAPPARVLSWPGKTIPAAVPPQAGGYGYPRYSQAQPAYGAQLQPAPYAQGRGAPPAPYAQERRATMYPTAPAAYYPPPPQGYYPAPVQGPNQAYAPQPAQARPVAAYPSGLQAQPYYAPAPGAPSPAPGSTATAPNGVYPANTVPPQLAYPMAVPPQMAQPLVAGPAPPASIYAPPQAAAPQGPSADSNGSVGLRGQAIPNPTDPRLPQQVALNTAAPVQGARLYSLHREFGLQPDPTPPPSAEGQTVELVSSIDSGGAPDPTADTGDKPRTKQTTSTAQTATAQRLSDYGSGN